MKKITIVLALFLIVGVIGAFAQDSFTVDLSKLANAQPSLNGDGTIVVRSTAISPSRGGGAAYGFYQVDFPAGTFPANLPWADYNRCRVVLRYYRSNGNEIRQGASQAGITIAYDRNGSFEENDTGPGPNTPVKFWNVGGANGNQRPSSEAGQSIRPLTRAPEAMWLQRQGNTSVATIELVELTFFKQ